MLSNTCDAKRRRASQDIFRELRKVIEGFFIFSKNFSNFL
jgi:hypothetical protein